MQGYGYSVWAVPVHYKKIQAKYGTTHIPHVTLSTNHPKAPVLGNRGQKVTIHFEDKDLYRLPKMYEYEPPSNSVGFYCKIEGYANPLLHMTVSYDFNGNPADYIAPEEPVDAIIYSADTRSLEPSEWNFF